VVSVTSDVSASAPYQSAPPKPALPDPSQLTSSFAAMVDSNLPTDPSSTLPPAPEPAAPPRSANNSQASDNNPPRNTQGPDQPAPSRSDDSSNSNPPPANNTASANADNNAPQLTKGAKSDTSKSSDSKSADKTSSDSKQTGDATDQAKPADTVTVTQEPIAALIPLATGLANPQTTTANPNAPLAIAAAAIAATSSTTAATAPPALPNPAPAPKATTAAATNAKTAAESAALGATTTQQATDPAATTEAAVVTAAGAVTAKATTGFKTTLSTQGKTTTAAGGAQGTSDSPAAANASTANATGAAPQPTVEAKPDSANTLGDAVKPDGNSPQAASTTHDQSQSANGQAPAAPIDPNAQLAAVPQQLSNTTPIAASDKFTVTQATGAAVPVSGLAVEIAASVQGGKTHFEVRLDPADLGRIDVRIDVDRNGQVTSHLTVEKPETLTMLRQDAPQLQQALNDAGLKTGSGGLQFSLRDQSQSGQQNNNQNGAQPQRLVINEDDTIPAAVAGRSYGRMLTGNGGVDIRV
jgi:flagellar hook-length control protein FliK